MLRFIKLTCACAVGLMLAGCAQNEMNMADMKAPSRPAELDQLDPLVGHWEGSWECSVPGTDKPMKGTGTNTIAWDVDRWVMIERMTGDMAEMGKFTGIGVWTWNPEAKAFDNWFYDSWGSSGHGSSKYDPATRTWKTRSHGTNPMTGRKTRGEGTMKLVGANQMEWTFTEFDGLTKTMDMKGTSTRK